MSENQLKVSELRSSYPAYFMSKAKVNLDPKRDVDGLLIRMKENYSKQNPIAIDGVKIEFDNSWVHLRKSNTEPIIRIYSESKDIATATALGLSVKNTVLELI